MGKFTEKLRHQDGQTLDLRVKKFFSEKIPVKKFPRIAKFPRPEDGLRAVVERAPQAEAFAATWIERIRPAVIKIYVLRHRIATVAVTLLAASLFVHVMFGDNGMVVYKQKRAEFQQLRKQVALQQQENERITQQIQSLKSDQQAIEKEAREQLGYAKPGEYVYVSPAPPKPQPPANHTAKK
jgi:cell division protein FtsB